MLITDVNEVEIAEGDRVESMELDTDGWLGTIDQIDAYGTVHVEWDNAPGQTYSHRPVRVMKIEA